MHTSEMSVLSTTIPRCLSKVNDAGRLSEAATYDLCMYVRVSSADVYRAISNACGLSF